MNDFTEVKIEVFIPAEFLDALREALAGAGAGQIGRYDHCCTVMEVRGYWRPLEGANPFQGAVGQVEQGTECKVEVNCKRERVEAVLKAIRGVHPYEQPVVNILPLLNHCFAETK